MEKKYYVLAAGTKSYKTYDEAEANAKRSTANNGGCGGQSEYVVAEAIAVTKMPVPEIEVVKIT